jgi:tetratricopeptide (TPR) repeat protein
MGYEQAVAAYRVALRGAHADRIDILIELGEAQLYAGDLDGARETCAKAARLAQDAGRAEGLARAALGMGTGLGGFEVRLYDEHQIALLEQALGLLPNEDSPLRAAVLARLSVAYSQGQISGMIFGAGLGLFEIAIVCLGVRLGLYRALAEIGPSTSATLASVTDLDERYIREWLQAQAVSGYLTADGPELTTARFILADGAYQALVDETNPSAAHRGVSHRRWRALRGVRHRGCHGASSA